MATLPELLYLGRDLADLKIEIYGDKDRQDVGLKTRVEKIERVLGVVKLIAGGVVINIALSATGPVDWTALAGILAALIP